MELASILYLSKILLKKIFCKQLILLIQGVVKGLKATNSLYFFALCTELVHPIHQKNLIVVMRNQQNQKAMATQQVARDCIHQLKEVFMTDLKTLIGMVETGMRRGSIISQ